MTCSTALRVFTTQLALWFGAMLRSPALEVALGFLTYVAARLGIRAIKLAMWLGTLCATVPAAICTTFLRADNGAIRFLTVQ